jgi:peptide deformylase
MAIWPIRRWGDPVLRSPAAPVTNFGKELRKLVDDLMETMIAAPGAGLAAPQIGVGLRVFTYNTDGASGHVVNPTIEVSDEPQEGEEGCLSIPGLYFPRRRAARAVVRGVDAGGREVTVEGEGYLARCLQHETDHLDGILYVDRMERDERRQALRAIRQAELAGFQALPDEHPAGASRPRGR